VPCRHRQRRRPGTSLSTFAGETSTATWPGATSRLELLADTRHAALRGWANYFQADTVTKAYRAIDNYTAVPPVVALQPQGPATPRRGLSTLSPLGHFGLCALGLPSLTPGNSAQSAEPPCTDPYARWCGRAEPRGSRYPDHRIMLRQIKAPVESFCSYDCVIATRTIVSNDQGQRTRSSDNYRPRGRR